MDTLTYAPVSQPVHAQLVTNDKGVILAQVDAGRGGNLSVAQAVMENGHWRVRSMLAGHEEIVDSLAAATSTLIADLHEAFTIGQLETSALAAAV